ncbi:MAG: hypothetical protein JSU98_07650 [Gemmatimonadales bacterium]|nr:MAG: hypothetical protein JSU98_07650 [Gemmatimonadales bacterium]
MSNKPSRPSTSDATRAPDLPRWLPPVAFAVVTLILFRDFVFSGEMLFGVDTEAMGYMARAFFAQELASGNFPGWNPLLLGGTPFLASLSGGDSLYPPSLLLLLLLEPYRALGWKLVLHVFLAGVGMYGWSRSLGVSRAAGMIGGLGYLVAPFLVTLVYPGHDGKLFVTALAPFLFWGVEAWFQGGSRKAWAGIAVTVALVILTTHFQMAYFLFGAAGAYAIFRTVQILLVPAHPADPKVSAGTVEGVGGEGGGDGAPAAAGSGGDAPGNRDPSRGPRSAPVAFLLFLAASVTGAGLAGIQFLPAVDYITEFSRRTATTTQASPEENRLYASSWSLHQEEAMSLVIPEFVGNNSNGSDWATGTYWGRNPFKLNHEYLGLGMLLLALLSFVGGPRRGLRLFLLGLGLVAFLYALGAHTPVWHLFFAVLPGIKLFRAPSMAIFLAGLAVAGLAAFGVDRMLAWVRDPGGEGDASKGQRLLWVATGLLAVLLLLAGAGTLTSFWTGTLYTDFAKTAALAAAQPFILRGTLLATVIAASLGVLLLLGRKGTLQPTALVAVLAVLVTVDGARIDAAFIETRDFFQFNTRGPNIDALLSLQETQEPFRVLDLGEPQMGQGVRSAMFGLEIASGHHPNDLARYRELTGMVGSGMPENLLTSGNLRAILNVGYIIWPVRQFGTPEGMEAISATQLGNGEVFEAVYAVPTLPRARLVAEAEAVPDDQAVARLMDPEFDVASTVTVPEPLPIPLDGGLPQGSVRWVERDADRQELRVATDRRSLLVLADNWYPAWHASVDGREAPVLRVNHTLRGIPLDPGEHTVVLEFRSANVRTGLIVTVLSGLVVLAVAFGSAFTRRRGRSEPSQESA